MEPLLQLPHFSTCTPRSLGHLLGVFLHKGFESTFVDLVLFIVSVLFQIPLVLMVPIMPSNEATDFPPFSSLPLLPSGPRGNAWGRFGSTDVLGMLNLLTPEVVAAAALDVKTGERISLDWPLNKPLHPSYKRPAFQHQVINRAKGEELRVVNDDFLAFNTQSSSQWDGFRHFGKLSSRRDVDRKLFDG